MSQTDKLIQRVLSFPTDLTYSDFVRFMKIFGYVEDDSPNGSRVKFYKKDGNTFRVFAMAHKPHGKSGAVMKVYMLREAVAFLREANEL